MGGSDSETEAAIEEDTAVSSGGSGVYTIEHGGRTFQVVKKASSIYVEGTPEILSHVCNACLDVIADETKLATARDADTDDATSAARLETADAILAASPEPVQRTPIQQGGLPVHDNNSKVQWMSKANSFQVTYTDVNGKNHRSIAGLRVRAKDREGKPLSPEGYREGFREALRNAKATWNRMDHSVQDRFDMGDEL